MKRLSTVIAVLILGAGIGALAVFLYLKAGRPALPVTAVPVETAKGAPVERKILYYRHPMNPQATSTVPKKDEMGMDYIPVYEEEAAPVSAPGTVRISPEKIQTIGVKSEQAKRRTLKRVIRTVGRVEPVENMVYVINTKVSGWVEKLYVNRTDQMVHKGDPLLELYSPDLVTAQEEYLLARKSLEKVRESPYEDVRKGAQDLLEAARSRLKYWDISDDQIKRLEETGKTTRTMILRAPANGTVAEKMVVEGQKIESGEPLFKIIDHSEVWVYGEVYEYELPYIKVGELAEISASYSPNEVYKGRIEHIYSHLGSIRYAHEAGTEVRTAKVRFSLPNPEGRLKLGMYFNVEISVVAARGALSVPDSAVIDTGVRQLVIVDNMDGTFTPRAVAAGVRSDGYYEIKKGVKEGERVVTSANFLIDAESNIRAAVSGMGAAGEHRHGDLPKTD